MTVRWPLRGKVSEYKALQKITSESQNEDYTSMSSVAELILSLVSTKLLFSQILVYHEQVQQN